jgi:thiamine-phosphate pyrophosphorylase
MKFSLQHCQLYAILDTGYLSHEQILPMAQLLIDAGVRIIQLRAKRETPQEILALGRQLHPLTRAAKLPLIVNDHLEVAQELQAEGLHLGQDDLSIATARQALGPEAILGLSTHSLQQLRRAIESAELLDYVGFGPLYATATKPNYSPIGLSSLQEAHQMMAISKKPLPIFCIGGVTSQRLPEIVTTGAKRICVVSELLQTSDPIGLVKEYHSILPVCS